jgi:hypothetical protein
MYSKEGIMDGNKPKEGVSVKEIESFAKKHRFEVFLCLAFFLACFFSFVMFGAAWTVIAATAGTIIGVLLPGKVQHLCSNALHFIFKQESVTQLILAGVGLILAIFIPQLYFFLLGLHGGKDMRRMTNDSNPHIQ